MKDLLHIFSKIKQLIPYLILIILYFLIINLEAIRDKKNYNNINEIDSDIKSSQNNKKIVNESKLIDSQRMLIPVFPYNGE